MTPQNFVTLPREVVEWAKDTTTISQLYKLLNAALTEQVQQPKITGWPAGLLQDDCRGLARWLSSRPDALYRLRELYAEQVQPAQSKGLFIDLIAAEGPEFVAEMAAIGCTQPAQGELETLLEKYWGLAYSEGKTGVMRGNEANEVLCKIRDLLQSNAGGMRRA